MDNLDGTYTPDEGSGASEKIKAVMTDTLKYVMGRCAPDEAMAVFHNLFCQVSEQTLVSLDGDVQEAAYNALLRYSVGTMDHTADLGARTFGAEKATALLASAMMRNIDPLNS